MREHVARVFDEARRQSKPNIESGIARGRADAEIMNMPLRSETPGTALSEETRRDHEVTAIAKALGFLSSAIKSGEPWSEQCDAMKRAAFSALDSICLRTKEREEAAALPSSRALSETVIRDAFLAGVEDAVGAERCGAEYDAPSREYAAKAIDRLTGAPQVSETRTFDLGDVLTIIDGRLVSPRMMEGVYDILNFMMGDSIFIFTHQIPRAMQACRPALLAQHPQLADVDRATELNAENIWTWLATQKRIFGESLPVTSLARPEPPQVSEIAINLRPTSVPQHEFTVPLSSGWSCGKCGVHQASAFASQPCTPGVVTIPRRSPQVTSLSESEIAAIRERLANRTPGEWYVDGTCVGDLAIRYRHDDDDAEDADPNIGSIVAIVTAPHADAGPSEADAAFIAHAPADLEALLAEREGMKAEIERLGNVVDGFRREATSWRDVANAHAEKLARVPTLECGAKACREAAVYVYVKNQLSAGGGVSPFRYLRCDRHSMNGATRMALSEAQ